MLILPWPPSDLSPNRVKHWTVKARAKAKYRNECMWLAQEAGKPEFAEEFIHLHIVFYPPTKRRFDLDNALASIKSGLDGVAEAWIVNDRRFRPITVDFGAVTPGGKVEINIVNNKQ